MQAKGFIPWLFSELKKPFFVGTNNLVQQGDETTLLKPDGQPAHLQHAPDGWKDTLVNWKRSLTYLGLFVDFTMPMTFVKDGAKILRHVLWTKGKNAIIYFALHKLNRLVYPTAYEAWFSGEIDLTKSRQKQNNKSFTVNVMQGGLSKLLAAGENTVYDIPINTDRDRKIIYLDGLPFTNKILYTVYNNQEIEGTTDPQYYWLGMGIIDKVGHSQGVIVQDAPSGSSTAFPNEDYFYWSVTKTVNVRVFGNVKGACTMGTGGILNLDIRRASDSVNTVFETRNISVPGTFNSGDPFSHDFDETITVNPHERLYIRIGARFATNKFMVYESQINVEYDVTFEPTFAECLTPYTLFERLTEKITDGKYGIKSTFLQSLDDILYTSGTALRRYQGVSSIKTSLSELFQDLRTKGRKKYSIGLGIDGEKLVIEELDYFFRNEIIMDLGIVDDLEVFVAEDLLYNTIKTGYKDQTIDDLNGRDEVNVTQLYSTPNTRSPKELNLVSPYRADPYGIESARSDQFGQQSTSSTADNETFVLSVVKQPTIDTLYYSGPFNIEIISGTNYISIPGLVLPELTNGLKLVVAGTTLNDGVYTIIATEYPVLGYQSIKVFEPVINEIVASGTLTSRNEKMYNLKRLAYTSITGVAHPTLIYNIELSPKRQLLNCGGLIHSVHDKEDIKFIKFESAPRNVELSTTLAGVTITEKDSVVIGSLQSKLFLEYYMTFSTRVPIDYTTLMNVNPYGRVKFTDGKTGIVLYGFMWDGGIKPEPKDKQNWKLIAAPNQDLSKFI